MNQPFLKYLLIALMLLGCQKKSPVCDTYSNLYLKVPYQKYDIVNFTDGKGNLLSFTVQDIKTGYFNDRSNGFPDCIYYNDYMQYQLFTFREANCKDSIWIGNFMKNDTLSPGGQCLSIYINGFWFGFGSPGLSKFKDIYASRIFLNKLYQNVKYVTYTFDSTQIQFFYNNDKGILCFKTDSITWYLN